MAKHTHEKRPRCGAFQIARTPLVLFGRRKKDGRQTDPFRIPAGAFYGRDSRGYWAFLAPSSAWRAVKIFPVIRFTGGVWTRCREMNTGAAMLILENLPFYDADDLTPKGRNPHKSRALVRGHKIRQEEREKEWARIKINPAEVRFSALDYASAR